MKTIYISISDRVILVEKIFSKIHRFMVIVQSIRIPKFPRPEWFAHKARFGLVRQVNRVSLTVNSTSICLGLGTIIYQIVIVRLKQFLTLYNLLTLHVLRKKHFDLKYLFNALMYQYSKYTIEIMFFILMILLTKSVLVSLWRVFSL